MKKLFVLGFALSLALAAFLITGCTNQQSQQTESNAPADEPKTVTIKSYNAQKEIVDVEVPFKPQRVAILDLPSLDIIDALGQGETVVASADTKIPYLSKYMNDKVAKVGTIKEPNLEALMAAEPDIIFIGGRLAKQYDELAKIAPVVFLGVDTKKGVVESTKENAHTIATIFGVSDTVDPKFDEYTKRLEAIAAKTNGATMLTSLVTSGSMNILGADGRLSLISTSCGMKNIATEEVTATHGNESSFENVLKLNPEWIFVLDRDAAINKEGAQLAQDILNNDVMNKTAAAQNKKIVYLENPAVWYTAEGGVQALDIMISDVEKGIAQAQ